MHRSTVLLGLALAAGLLPFPAGGLAVGGGALLGVGWPGLLGLSALAAAARLAGPSATLALPSDPSAVRLVGCWRDPPMAPAFLATARGDLAVTLAESVQAPAAGTPVEVLARVSGGRAQAVSVRALGPARGAWLDRWSAACRERIARLVARDRRGLVEALLLGEREDLSAAVIDDCVVTGTYHLLALSGSHVAVLAALLHATLRPLVRRAEAWTALLLLAFVLLTGALVPLVRSFLGWCLLAAGAATGRSTDALVRLGSVALLLMACAPGSLDTLSAQLSFVAVAGMIAAANLVPRPWPLLVAPAGAVLATAPLCVAAFGTLQPWGLLTTLLVTPLVSALLALGAVAVVPVDAFSALDGVLGPLLDGCAELLQWLLAELARLCPPPLVPARPPVPPLLLSLLLIGLMVLAGRRRGRKQGPWLT